MKLKILPALRFLLFAMCFIYILSHPYQTAFHCSSALKMCAFTVIPSLFTFIAFSQILPGIVNSFLENSSFEKRFNLNIDIISNMIFGITAGAVPACSCMKSMYNSKKISKEYCEELLMLFNGCSASFIICVAGTALDDFLLASVILVCNTFSTAATYIILHDKPFTGLIKNKNIYLPKKQSFISTAAKAISDTSAICINMCSYIIFFRVISGYVCDFVSQSISNNKYIITLIQGIFEVTSGINMSGILDGNEKILIVAFLTSLSGISIFFQVSHFCNDMGISAKKFVLSKLLSSVICVLLTVAFMIAVPSITSDIYSSVPSEYSSINEISHLPVTAIAASITVIILIITVYIDKKHKKLH